MESDLSITATEESVKSMLPPATGSSNINVDMSERIASVFLGAATTSFGLRHLTSLGGLTVALTGGFLLYRGLTGYCPVNKAIGRNTANRRTPAMETKQTISIDKPRSEVYTFWRRLENLPLFMKHLEEVKVEDSMRSIWKAKVPGGLGTVSWEAVITDDQPNELLSWSSLPGSTVDNAGEVRFKDSVSGYGTDIEVCITYRLPGGDLGSLAGKLFNPIVEKMIREDVKGFKSIIETGESATTDLQVSPSMLEAEPTKVKKTRQSRKKPDPSIEHHSDQSSEYNESDLLERH
jgi:uncharacterized membrane protein